KSLQEFLDGSRSQAEAANPAAQAANPPAQSQTSADALAHPATGLPASGAQPLANGTAMPRSAQGQRSAQTANRTVMREDGVSVIGRDLAILGNDLKIVSRGKIQIEGEVRGDVYGDQILIGDQGRVSGTVAATQVVVRGAVQGTVRGKEVILASTANVDADVHHASLSLEQGAVFEGRSRRPQNVDDLVPDLESLTADTPAAEGTSGDFKPMVAAE
ncbi:MAG: polymer-forming cytoskeletal protein, partial [Pseudomonadota bacterium]